MKKPKKSVGTSKFGPTQKAPAKKVLVKKVSAKSSAKKGSAKKRSKGTLKTVRGSAGRGSSRLTEDFLVAQKTMKDTRSVAIKEKLAKQLMEAMEKEEINKVEMAQRMKTSRAALDRLLDPGNGAVTLQTLLRAAKAVGRGLRVELV